MNYLLNLRVANATKPATDCSLEARTEKKPLVQTHFPAAHRYDEPANLLRDQWNAKTSEHLLRNGLPAVRKPATGVWQHIVDTGTQSCLGVFCTKQSHFSLVHAWYVGNNVVLNVMLVNFSPCKLVVCGRLCGVLKMLC